MEISIGSLVSGAQNARGIAVVIDVYRCFTTEAIAFQNGAKKIILVAEIEEALYLKSKGVGDLVMGEVGGRKPDGFDFGNSPYELKDIDLSGKTIIQSTRAGTVGVTNVSGAEIIYGGSLVVAEATTIAIQSRNPSYVSLVAMGLEGRIRSDEDEQCALYLRNVLQGRFPDKKAVKSLIMAGEESQKYDDSNLIQWPAEDRTMALQIDSHNFALRITVEDGQYVSRPEYV